MPKTVTVEVQDGLATMCMSRAHGNAINGELVDDLATACAEVEANAAIRGALLCGLARLMGEKWALSLSSVIFGLWHLGAVLDHTDGDVIVAIAVDVQDVDVVREAIEQGTGESFILREDLRPFRKR